MTEQPQEPPFWDKKTTFTCKDCGYVMSLSDHAEVKQKHSSELETNINYFTCPQCGKEAIVLW